MQDEEIDMINDFKKTMIKSDCTDEEAVRMIVAYVTDCFTKKQNTLF